MADDAEIIAKIHDLVEEEHRLRQEGPPDQDRLARLEVLVDQCWDLLRQHRARDEFHQPDTAAVRPPDTVEGYQQ
jgi:hypothetical protein